MSAPSQASLVSSGDAFRIEAEVGAGVVTIRPVGLINEDVNFAAVLEFVEGLGAKPTKIVLDLASINRINSCGVREWLLLMQRLQARFQCAFSKADEAFIVAASSIPTVFGSPACPIEQIEAPFFCSQCNRRTLLYLKTADLQKGGSLSVPPQKCAQCGTVLDFDEVEEEYFHFLKHLAK